MKFGAILAALLLVFATVTLPDDADAARMGGGKSFGSRPSMSQQAQRPAVAQRQQTSQQTPGAAAKPGLFGGMGGLFGGLLAGTMLGSLLSGGGFGGGGFMDILILAILAFIGWKLFQRFRANRQEQAAGEGGMFRQTAAPMREQLKQSEPEQGGMWDRMRNAAGATGMAGAAVAAPQTADGGVDVPAGFDVDEFLRGAKMAYTRMQQSWDKRDLNDIGQFATKAVMRELQAQAAADPNPSHTEIMMVNAELAGAEEEGDNMRAQVYFDVLMREDPNQQTPENVREIWHFLRIGQNGNWKLDGIQQVD